MYRESLAIDMNTDQLSNAELLLKDFIEVLDKGQANVPYNFNILDEQVGHIVENSHTNILMKILQYKNKYQNKYIFLESFFNYLNIPITIKDNEPVLFDRERFSEGKQKNGRIDGFIYQNDSFALIIENKVNHAGPTKRQLTTYIQGIQTDPKITDINGDADLNKIWVIYLTENGIDKPQRTDVEFLIRNGICSEESSFDNYADIQGERYFAVNYLNDILPWLKKEIQPIVMQREQVLNTGLLQYIDFLEGMLGKRQQDINLMERCKDVLDDSIKKIINNYDFATQNKILSEIYYDLKKIKKYDDEESEQKHYAASILKNLIEKKNEEPLKLFFDITRKYFESHGMKKCVIHPVFNFYYIQIRDASWPRSIHFEWFPLGINKIVGKMGKKCKDYTLCFHVEAKKDVWSFFEDLFDTSPNNFMRTNKRSRTLEYKKTINSETSILNMLDDEGRLNAFLERAYSEITPDLINRINERIDKMMN